MYIKLRKLLALVMAIAMVLSTAASAAEPGEQEQPVPEMTETVQAEEETPTETVLPEPEEEPVPSEEVPLVETELSEAEEAPVPQEEPLSSELSAENNGASLLSITRTPIDVTGVESAHPYTNNTDQSWTVSCPGAEQISLVFDTRTALDGGTCDYLTIIDGSGNRFGMYNGDMIAGHIITVPGETVVLRLTSNDSVTRWGFKVTEAYGDVRTGAFSAAVTPPEHGTLTVFPMIYDAGETLQVTATPDPGCKLSAIYVDGTRIDGNKYVASGSHTISAEFTEYHPGGVAAQNGTCGDQMEWCFYEDGLLLISGTGVMSDYRNNADRNNYAPWYSLCRSIHSVVITDGVTEIGSCAFHDCSNLTSVSLPQSVTSIHAGAFEYCNSLTAVDLPSNITFIGESAFYGCVNLTSIVLPQGITSIENYTFWGCKCLTSVTLPQGLLSIGRSAFCCCSFSSIVIPQSVTTIENYAFDNCSSLQKVFYTGNEEQWKNIKIYSDNLPLIHAPRVCNADAAAFYTLNLTSPASGGSISVDGLNLYTAGEQVSVLITPETGYRLSSLFLDGNPIEGTSFRVSGCHMVSAKFEECRPGEVVSYSAACGDQLYWYLYQDGQLWITGIGPMQNYSYFPHNGNNDIPWYSHRDNIKAVVLTEGVTSIGNAAFYGCSSLASVVIPESITSIGDSAFHDCSSLTSVAIPEGTAVIGDSVFCGCSSLTSVIIPQDVTSIEAYAFANCFGLEKVFYTGSPEQWQQISIVYDNEPLINAARIHHAAVDAFYTLTLEQPAGGSISVEGLNLYTAGEQVTVQITPDAGYYFGTLLLDGKPIDGTSFVVSGNHTVSAVFEEHHPGVAIAHSGTCGSQLNWFLYEDGQLWIVGTGMMQNYSWSNDGGSTAPWSPYRNSITSVVLTEGVTDIGHWAFRDCSNLTSVVIPEGVTYIGYRVFYECSSLTSVIIPQSVTSIQDDVFYGCSSLKKVFYTGSKEQWQQISLGLTNEYLTEAQRVYHAVVDAFYTLTLEQAANGHISVDGLNLYTAGEQVTVQMIPDAGYQLKTLFLDGTPIDGITFVVSGNHTISAEFELIRPDNIAIDGGSCGPETAWALYRDGELRITGCGPMKDYAFGSMPWALYRNADITKLVIESTVTAIGDNAFSGCNGLTSVTVPGTITRIGSHAFSDCAGLNAVTLEKGITTIGSHAFQDCTSLPAITIPSTVSVIDAYAFSGCQALTNMELPAGVEVLGDSAFTGCDKLQSVTIPGGLKTFGKAVFDGCQALSDVKLQEGLTSIGNYAFRICTALTQITLPDSLTAIGTGAFQGCTGLEQLTMPPQLATIGIGALASCTGLTTISIPASVTTLDPTFVNGCTALTAITVDAANPAYSAQDGVLFSQDGKSLIRFPEGKSGAYTVPVDTAELGECALADCTLLTAIVLPDGLTTIGAYAFDRCSSLSDLSIPETVSSIGAGAFRNCQTVRALILPNNLTEIKDSTFSGCSSLFEVSFTKSVTSIGSCAFSGCRSLHRVLFTGNKNNWASISISGGNEELTSAAITYLVPQDQLFTVTKGTASPGGSFTLSGSRFLAGETVTVLAVPDSTYYVKTILVDDTPIEGNSFQVTGNHVVRVEFARYENSIDSGTCGSNVQWVLYENGELHLIGTGSMYDYIYNGNSDSCDSPWYAHREKIKRVVVDTGITAIGECAFINCTHLTSVSLPEGITRIGYKAFSNCTSLTSVHLPSTVNTIGSYAFCYCSALSSINLPEGIIYIAENTFCNCALTEIVIPEGVEEIGGRAFLSCDLKTIILPHSIHTIRCDAFDSYQIETVFYYGTEADWKQISIENNNTLLRATRKYVTAETPICTISIGTITGSGEIHLPQTKFVAGDTVSVTVTPASDQSLKHILVDGKPIVGTTFPVTGNHVVSAEFIPYAPGVGILGSGPCGKNLTWTLYASGQLLITGTGEMDDYGPLGSPWFASREQITSVVLEPGITSIGGRAFYSCSSLTAVTIPSGITSIGANAFDQCSRLQSAEFLGNAPTSIYDGTHYNTSFPSGTPGEFMIYYHAGATGWTSPTWHGYPCSCIEETLTEYSTLDTQNRNVQGILFTLNEEASTATVGSNTQGQNNAGYTGNGNGHVVIPKAVTKDGKTYQVIGIGQNAFSQNKLLKTLHLEAELTALDASAFVGCTKLEAFSCDAANGRYTVSDGILYDTKMLTLFCYPAGKTGDTFTVSASVRTISQNAFHSSVYLKELIVPETVTAIQANAFGYCDALEKITLPFIGGSKEDGKPFSYVMQSEMPKLKTVVITGNELLKGEDFSCYPDPYTPSNPQFLEEITIPSCGTEIPYCAFQSNRHLKQIRFADQSHMDQPGTLTLPEGVKIIGNQAFRDCDSLEHIYLPASLERIDSDAFDSCEGMKEFHVADGSRHFMSDQWGVLYSKNQDILINYPSARVWPYYNVPDVTITVRSNAFRNCKDLKNLYIPKTVTELNNSVQQCPGLTLCIYQGSPADTYAASNDLNLWYMDNMQLSGVQVYSTPDAPVLLMGQEDLSGLYVVKTYTGSKGTVTLQADDYDVSYSSGEPGVQQATVTSGGYSDSFDVVRYDPDRSVLLSAEIPGLLPEETVYAAAYDQSGRMLTIQDGIRLDGNVYMLLSNAQYRQMAEARVFRLKDGKPVGNWTAMEK